MGNKDNQSGSQKPGDIEQRMARYLLASGLAANAVGAMLLVTSPDVQEVTPTPEKKSLTSQCMELADGGRSYNDMKEGACASFAEIFLQASKQTLADHCAEDIYGFLPNGTIIVMEVDPSYPDGIKCTVSGGQIDPALLDLDIVEQMVPPDILAQLRAQLEPDAVAQKAADVSECLRGTIEQKNNDDLTTMLLHGDDVASVFWYSEDGSKNCLVADPETSQFITLDI